MGISKKIDFGYYRAKVASEMEEKLLGPLSQIYSLISIMLLGDGIRDRTAAHISMEW